MKINKLWIIALMSIMLMGVASAYNQTYITNSWMNISDIYVTNLTVREDIYASGNMTINNMTLTGNLSMGQKLIFAFDEMIDNIVNGWLRVTGALKVVGDLNVTGDTNVSGDVNVGGNLNVTGDMNVSSDTYVNNINITGKLKAYEGANITGDVNITGNLNMSENNITNVDEIITDHISAGGARGGYDQRLDSSVRMGYTYLSNGVAGTPAYNFVDDTNTGIWRPDSDILSFQVGGLSRLNLSPSDANYAFNINMTGRNITRIDALIGDSDIITMRESSTGNRWTFGHDTTKFQIDSPDTNVTEIASETHLNQNMTAGASVIIGDEISSLSLFSISSNGTDVLIQSFESLPIRLLTYSPNGSDWMCYTNNSGSFVCDSR